MIMNNKQLLSLSRRGLWPALTGVTAIAAVVAALFGQPVSNAESPPAAPPATPVSVATVAATDITAWDEFSGRLEAVERVDVRSRVAGAVQAVHFKEGSLVKQGELLITIDPAPYAADVDRAEAQVAAAQARVSQAQSEHVRASRLWD
ncbi:MAG: biotin/lipoyl-binding protein, partial [Variovorax sp.]